MTSCICTDISSRQPSCSIFAVLLLVTFSSNKPAKTRYGVVYIKFDLKLRSIRNTKCKQNKS